MSCFYFITSKAFNVFKSIALLIGLIINQLRVFFLQGETFEVPAGSLAFSVMLYTVFAICCIALLMLRRNIAAFGKAELGGSTGLKVASAVVLMTLWVLYVLLSSLEVYGIIKAGF